MASNRKRLIARGLVTTTDATETTILTITLPSNHNIGGRILCVARNTSTGAQTVIAGHAGAKNVSGTVTVGGSVGSVSGLGDMTISLASYNSGNDMLIKVTGLAATTIDWDCEYEYLEN